MTSKVYDTLRNHMLKRGPEVVSARYGIKKVQDEQLVTGQVYAPDTLDAHGHFMTTKELRRVAHDFLANGLQTQIDVMHNNEAIDAVIVESFIARKGDPDFEEGSWVATTLIRDPFYWNLVKDGILNSYSFEILTYRRDLDVAIEFESYYYGFTDPDPHDKHDHPFMVRLDANGEILWGRTGEGSDGSPGHIITNSNITDAMNKHTHRIHLRQSK